MIRRTFQLIPGVGPGREKTLWQKGVHDWAQLLDGRPAPGLSRNLVALGQGPLQEAEAALAGRDLQALSKLLPSREHWRLYPEFAGEAVFLDIETDGGYRQTPTVVSLYRPGGFEVFVQGRNLAALPEALARHRLWVSFNGSCFDLPVLREHFGRLPVPAVHLDLRFICHRLGWRGGLKSIEDRLGFGRPRHLMGVDGMDAVHLWRAWEQERDVEAMRFLVEYNLYDTIQLRTLMDRAFNQAVEEAGFGELRRNVFDRGEMLYDLSRYLLELGPAPDEKRLLRRVRG